MKYYNKKGIQKILFSNILSTMLIILICTTAIFSVALYNNMKNNVIDSLQQTCSAVSKDIDLQLHQLDTVCINILYSNLIKNTFGEYSDTTSHSSYQNKQYESTLSGYLTSIRGVYSDIRQINLYSLNGGCYGTGNFIGYQDINASLQEWYLPTIEAGGSRYIPTAAKNALLSKSAGTNLDRYYLSLYRLYFDNYHQPQGIIEVAQYYDTLFERAYHLESSYNIKIMIYDSDGNLLFPIVQESTQHFPYFKFQTTDSNVIEESINGKNELMCFSNMEEMDFTVVAAIQKNELFAPIYTSLATVMLLLLAATLFCYKIALALSRRLSAPLTEMYHYLTNSEGINQQIELPLENSGVLEIDALKDSLKHFQKRQKETIDSMLLLKEQEVQSQMLALQSQMNPHFLYNSLSTINAMAEEGMNEEISVMCNNITEILRYISSNKKQVTSLEEELEHCTHYLQCLQLRYENALSYTIDVDDEMLELPIPKLCTQLLVENAVKFTTKTTPPWHISIEGRRDKNQWYVCVRDNGPGFQEDVIKTLHKQIDEINKNGLLPCLELNGMGLLNIYIRFYLIYHAVFIFELGNQKSGGAFVTIGGKTNEEALKL